MLADPAEEPITSPVDEMTVATAGLLLVHTPPGMVEVNEFIDPTQISVEPLITPALGNAVIVTTILALASAHPAADEGTV
jgi:hypothetical protein